jgi:hypothetical protein
LADIPDVVVSRVLRGRPGVADRADVSPARYAPPRDGELTALAERS